MKAGKDRRTQGNSTWPSSVDRRREGGARHQRIGYGDRFRSYLTNHRDVANNSLRRMLAAPVPSIMTWAVIAIALALPAGLYLLLANAQQLSNGWDRATQISLYLKMDQTEAQGRALSASLATRDAIKSTEYISKKRALQEFQALSGFGEALNYLQDNPLPAVIVVHPATGGDAKDYGTPEQAQTLLSELSALPQIEQAQLDLEWVQRLYSIMALGRQAVAILGGLLSLAVLLIIGNTIRLAIEARREEIIVVKLVGGTDAFVRRPFLYTGIWYGIGGGLFAWVLISLVLYGLNSPIVELSALYQSDFKLSGLGIGDTLLLWLLSGLLGLGGAWAATARHLSRMNP